MFVDNERTITPQQEIVHRVVDEIITPWHDAGLTPPSLVVSEVARTAGLPPTQVINVVLESNNLSLEDIWGKKVNGNLREAAIASAPVKRVLRHSTPQSFTEVAFEKGRDRLKITPLRY